MTMIAGVIVGLILVTGVLTGWAWDVYEKIAQLKGELAAAQLALARSQRETVPAEYAGIRIAQQSAEIRSLKAALDDAQRELESVRG